MLVAAVLKTLLGQEALEDFHGAWPAELMDEELPFLETPPEKGLWLKVGKEEWKEWSPEVVLSLYSELGGARVAEPATLDLWLLAVGGEVSRYWELQQGSLSRPIMASLVERGANPLRALQIAKQTPS
mgnify:CR=1 FL=1|jgi:hypothetical protein